MMTNSISLKKNNATALLLCSAQHSAQPLPSAERPALPLCTAKDFTDGEDLVDLVANTKPIAILTEMYSGLLEETISRRCTLHLVDVQVAAFFTIMPAAIPLSIRMLCLVWFITSISLAKREYRSPQRA